MAVSALARLAGHAAAPVYPAVGADGLAAVEDLSLHPAVALQATPRHAGVLLVAGAVRDDDIAWLRRVHDQLPHPRATLWWRTAPAPGFPRQEIIAADPAGAVHSLWRQLATGAHRSEEDLLPDEPPAPWRGKGDHGQGGEGMTGGRPYGRPMAMTDEDARDGLALDAYTASFGPFLPVLPPGLQLELTLQGDTIQSAAVLRPPVPQVQADAPLRRVARLLRLLGLAGLAERCLRAARVRGDVTVPARGALRRSGALLAIPPGLGEVAGEDVRARLRRWWAEANGDVAPAPGAAGRLADLLPGLEWNEAVLVVNSLEYRTLLDMCPRDGRNFGREDGT